MAGVGIVRKDDGNEADPPFDAIGAKIDDDGTDVKEFDCAGWKNEVSGPVKELEVADSMNIRGSSGC